MCTQRCRILGVYNFIKHKFVHCNFLLDMLRFSWSNVYKCRIINFFNRLQSIHEVHITEVNTSIVATKQKVNQALKEVRLAMQICKLSFVFSN